MSTSANPTIHISGIRGLFIPARGDSASVDQRPSELTHFLVPRMSPKGQQQTSDCRLLMSAIPPKADIVGRNGDLRFVPIVAIRRLRKVRSSTDHRLGMHSAMTP